MNGGYNAIPLKVKDNTIITPQPNNTDMSDNDALDILGISPKYSGYWYLKDCIALAISDPKISVSDLLSHVAASNEKTWAAVERSSRFAMNTCDQNSWLWKKLFSDYNKVTLKIFIKKLTGYYIYFEQIKEC